MEYYAESSIGKVRKENQDYFYIPTLEDDLKLFIIADGMGGYNGGKIASELAVDNVVQYIKNNFDEENIEQIVKKSVTYANKEVYEKSIQDKELEGMGTTIVACLIYNNKVYIGHIGDSRIYRLRKNVLRQVTKDHSYVEKLVRDGTITRQEAVNHPDKNMLTKALGCTPFVEPDITIKTFLKNDILVLTTDGLTNMITEEKMFKAIQENSHNLEFVAKELINEANFNGGMDNITVIIIKNQ